MEWVLHLGSEHPLFLSDNVNYPPPHCLKWSNIKLLVKKMYKKEKKSGGIGEKAEPQVDS